MKPTHLLKPDVDSGNGTTTIKIEMKTNSEYLRNFGICSYTSPFTGGDIAQVNADLDPLLKSRENERRAYVHVNELYELGVLQRLLSQPMRDILFSTIPDPVLYHCHVYEIAADDTRSHIFSQRLSGWHRDPDSELVRGEITHVSIFVYLTDVGDDDGGFEFSPNDPTAWLHSGTPRSLVTGNAGFTFAWQRSFYHRASPNRGPTRRRLFKVSVQRNRFISTHLKNPHFQALMPRVPEGDTALDILLGRYQGRTAPAVPVIAPFAYEIQSSGKLDISSLSLAKAQIRGRASEFKALLQGKKGSAQNAAYD
jgi:hypothetical protein